MKSLEELTGIQAKIEGVMMMASVGFMQTGLTDEEIEAFEKYISYMESAGPVLHPGVYMSIPPARIAHFKKSCRLLKELYGHVQVAVP